MYIVRPVRGDDLDGVVNLATQASCGLTTLPNEPDVLKRRIDESIRLVTLPPSRPGGECFLFVLEDTTTRTLCGTCAIATKVGGFEPWYTYRLRKRVLKSPSLGIRRTVHLLELRAEHDGPTEIGTLFLAPDARGNALGRLLSLSRFLFMAEHPHFFEPLVVAEMRGVIDSEGRSPFWNAIGNHFFGIELRMVDLMVNHSKAFIQELMPPEPIYVELLPPDAQAVIGKVHPETEPALHMLELEGFRRNHEVDIFEAGPSVSCVRSAIRTVRESQEAKLAVAPAGDGEAEWLVARAGEPAQWRVALSSLENRGPHHIGLPDATSKALEAAPGDPIRYAPLRARRE